MIRQLQAVEATGAGDLEVLVEGCDCFGFALGVDAPKAYPFVVDDGAMTVLITRNMERSP